ncbi:betaine/proline/choline family ABC transporter ATP-binding protein [Clostridium kluyveri]|uniref:Quaternary amine transport ATP-binding protein n=1 Tax=Clostridium kluyveri (strain ATCC 8527 / DSM 555 / NBRC 12016 / NCIMB 10680 / K1) TaxID=431943 RepID=A5N113_CLOK5|nr:betaine/proline/choline family ABC transporter ATP-binding protein [Clostridium kluyveri]EDK34809.1 Predicted ABC transporter, ATPase component [Clostridium kluyveri DSM 555]
MIEFKNVSKTINNKSIINNISLNVDRGELVTFIGPSGCGKTTTLKMINKLITPSSGEIFINRNKIEEEDTIKLRRNIGYVIQQTGLFPHMTVAENISLIPNIEKMDNKKIQERMEELLTLVGMSPKDYMNKYPNELSGGQQQRVGIVRALVMNPDIILMDEPFNALDPITRGQLQDEIFNIQQNFKKTIVFVTHDMDEALKLADRICIMGKGTVLQFDTPEEILKNPANDFVREFIGENRIWNQPELIKAKDIMIKNPIKSSGERTVVQALEIMKSNHVDSLLVVNENNNLIGLVTLKKIRLNMDKNKRLKDIMETEVITVSFEDSIVSALEKMEYNKMGYIPVIDDKLTLVGLITRSSLLSVMSNQFINKDVDI